MCSETGRKWKRIDDVIAICQEAMALRNLCAKMLQSAERKVEQFSPESERIKLESEIANLRTQIEEGTPKLDRENLMFL